MGLESYHDDAHEAMASFLQHAVTREGHQHPFSFCQLLGLTAGERDCLFSTCGFMMRKTGTAQELWFL